MSTAKHADFQALSAFVDGEAPEWADHVAGCPQCRATAAELRALAAKVAAPAEPPPAALREAAIAAALEAAGLDAGAGAAQPLGAAPSAGHQAHRARFSRSGRFAPRSWWAMPAIAAVVLACAGFAGVILSSTRSTDHETTTFAGPALGSKSESAVPGAPPAPVGDLGDVADAATLRARALGPVPPSTAGGAAASAARSSSNTGAASDAATSAPAPNVAPNAGSTAAGAAGGAGGAATAIAPNAVAARPCEDRARAREPGLGPVTYFATARKGTVAAYVLGFSSGPNVTLLMLAQDGCGELLRSAGP